MHLLVKRLTPYEKARACTLYEKAKEHKKIVAILAGYLATEFILKLLGKDTLFNRIVFLPTQLNQANVNIGNLNGQLNAAHQQVPEEIQQQYREALQTLEQENLELINNLNNARQQAPEEIQQQYQEVVQAFEQENLELINNLNNALADQENYVAQLAQLRNHLNERDQEIENLSQQNKREQQELITQFESSNGCDTKVFTLEQWANAIQQKEAMNQEALQNLRDQLSNIHEQEIQKLRTQYENTLQINVDLQNTINELRNNRTNDEQQKKPAPHRPLPSTRTSNHKTTTNQQPDTNHKDKTTNNADNNINTDNQNSKPTQTNKNISEDKSTNENTKKPAFSLKKQTDDTQSSRSNDDIPKPLSQPGLADLLQKKATNLNKVEPKTDNDIPKPLSQPGLADLLQKKATNLNKVEPKTDNDMPKPLSQPSLAEQLQKKAVNLNKVELRTDEKKTNPSVDIFIQKAIEQRRNNITGSNDNDNDADDQWEDA